MKRIGQARSFQDLGTARLDVYILSDRDKYDPMVGITVFADSYKKGGEAQAREAVLVEMRARLRSALLDVEQALQAERDKQPARKQEASQAVEAAETAFWEQV